MKYYSEILRKNFDTEEECIKAEKEREERLSKEKEKRELMVKNRKEDAITIEDLLKKYNKMVKDHKEEEKKLSDEIQEDLKEFNKKYGSFNYSYNDEDGNHYKYLCSSDNSSRSIWDIIEKIFF